MSRLPRNVQGVVYVRSRRNLTHAGTYRVHASRVPGGAEELTALDILPD